MLILAATSSNTVTIGVAAIVCIVGGIMFWFAWPREGKPGSPRVVWLGQAMFFAGLFVVLLHLGVARASLSF